MAKKTDQRIKTFQDSHLPRLIESYNPDHVLVFGSCARGTALKESDLDLLIVSRSFEGIPFVERAQQVIWAMRSYLSVEVLCYTPDEYERKRKEIGVVKIASQEGIDLMAERQP